MTSVLRRLSDASATSLTCSGRLFWAVQRVFRAGPPLGSGLQPNLVAITTWSRTVANAHSHTAEPESRDFQVAISKFARFHCFLLSVCLIPRLRANVLQAVA